MRLPVEGLVEYAGVQIDTAQKNFCRVNGTAKALSRLEYRLLLLLMVVEGELVDAGQISLVVWERHVTDEGTIKQLIRRLRRKVGEDRIESVYGAGYRLVVFR